jgi:hydroxyquinol 1,2-dioxygenase
MRTIDRNTITDAFLAYCAKDTNPRLRFVLERLVRHLHDFARETNLTHEEWRIGIDFLTRAGAITDAERNEFVLMSDVLGLSSLVDILNSGEGGTQTSVIGPFHIIGAPELPVGGDLKRDQEGDFVIVSGTVRDADGRPIKGAVLEIWQTALNGLYSNQDPDQPDFNLRARMTTDADGRYAFTTVRPAPYTVPDDGPVGDLLRATGREPWRPAHLHFIVIAKGYRTLVTELFPEDDPYIDQDAVFGVRDELTVRFVRHDDLSALPPGLAAADRIKPPFYSVDYDFVLVPGEGGSAASAAIEKAALEVAAIGSGR